MSRSAFDQIVAHLAEPPDAVRSALTDLRDSGLVAVLSIGETEDQMKSAVSYWGLSDQGREELARRKSWP